MPPPPGGSLCYCTCAQEAISTKSAGRKWLVSGLEDHRYLSVTKSATRREPVGGTPTSKQEPCSGMHLMLSLSTDPWICHISSRVQVCTDSNGNAESPSPLSAHTTAQHPLWPAMELQYHRAGGGGGGLPPPPSTKKQKRRRTPPLCGGGGALVMVQMALFGRHSPPLFSPFAVPKCLRAQQTPHSHGPRAHDLTPTGPTNTCGLPDHHRALVRPRWARGPPVPGAWALGNGRLWASGGRGTKKGLLRAMRGHT